MSDEKNKIQLSKSARAGLRYESTGKLRHLASTIESTISEMKISSLVPRDREKLFLMIANFETHLRDEFTFSVEPIAATPAETETEYRARTTAGRTFRI